MGEAERREATRNATIHDRIADEYDRRHGEIFNDVEQGRLRQALGAAIDAMTPSREEKLKALDFGCGTGNVTRHLLELGLNVTAVDVSENSLALLRKRYGHLGVLETRVLSDAELASQAPGQFDLVTTYSVLHHVPDYLGCVRGLFAMVRPGGVLFIDHEVSPSYWNPPPALEEFRAATSERRGKFAKLFDPARILNPRWWNLKLRRTIDRRYMPEGDIHLWPDDHVEWDKIHETLVSAGSEFPLTTDYLGYRSTYDRDLHREFASRCTDMRMMIVRKPLSSEHER